MPRSSVQTSVTSSRPETLVAYAMPAACTTCRPEAVDVITTRAALDPNAPGVCRPPDAGSCARPNTASITSSGDRPTARHSARSVGHGTIQSRPGRSAAAAATSLPLTPELQSRASPTPRGSLCDPCGTSPHGGEEAVRCDLRPTSGVRSRGPSPSCDTARAACAALSYAQ